MNKKSNQIFVIIMGIIVCATMVFGSGGWEDILRSNMLEAGLNEKQADSAINLSRNIEDAIEFDLNGAFIAPCTLAFIPNDAMSGYYLIIDDTLRLSKFFDLWEAINK